MKNKATKKMVAYLVVGGSTDPTPNEVGQVCKPSSTKKKRHFWYFVINLKD